MNRRFALKTLLQKAGILAGAVAAVGITAAPAEAYYFARFTVILRRHRRRHRRRRRRRR